MNDQQPIAQTILANTVDTLHVLNKMLTKAEEANAVDDAVKLARTIATIKRDAYAVQASAEASGKMAMAAMLGGASPAGGGGAGPHAALDRLRGIGDKLKGAGVGMTVPQPPTGDGQQEDTGDSADDER
jgi:hypothetical protein